MASISPQPKAGAISLPISMDVVWYGAAGLLALMIYYFVGIDQGATSVFGNHMGIHEFVHDARHFLGFPCH
jgi:hypothetical protein